MLLEIQRRPTGGHPRVQTASQPVDPGTLSPETGGYRELAGLEVTETANAEPSEQADQVEIIQDPTESSARNAAGARRDDRAVLWRGVAGRLLGREDAVGNTCPAVPETGTDQVLSDDGGRLALTAVIAAGHAEGAQARPDGHDA